MYVYVYVYVDLYVYVYVNVNKCMCVCICICVCVHVRVRVRECGQHTTCHATVSYIHITHMYQILSNHIITEPLCQS